MSDISNLAVNPIIIDDTRGRAAFTRVAEITNALNDIFRANIVIQPGFFLSEVQLNAGNTYYKFPTLNQGDIDNTVFPMSYGVNPNDIFIGDRRELTVDNRPATTSGLVKVQTYNNSFAFTAANTTTPAHIQFIFNANWSYKVGSKTYFQNEFTRQDLRQPFTQQSSATNFPYYDGNKLIDIDPYMVISGKATNYLELNLKTGGVAFAGEGIGGTVNCLSWFMLGNTLQNAAGFANFYTGGEEIGVWMAQYQLINAGLIEKGIIDRKKWTPLTPEASFGNLQ